MRAASQPPLWRSLTANSGAARAAAAAAAAAGPAAGGPGRRPPPPAPPPPAPPPAPPRRRATCTAGARRVAMHAPSSYSSPNSPAGARGGASSSRARRAPRRRRRRRGRRAAPRRARRRPAAPPRPPRARPRARRAGARGTAARVGVLLVVGARVRRGRAQQRARALAEAQARRAEQHAAASRPAALAASRSAQCGDVSNMARRDAGYAAPVPIAATYRKAHAIIARPATRETPSRPSSAGSASRWRARAHAASATSAAATQRGPRHAQKRSPAPVATHAAWPAGLHALTACETVSRQMTNAATEEAHEPLDRAVVGRQHGREQRDRARGAEEHGDGEARLAREAEDATRWSTSASVASSARTPSSTRPRGGATRAAQPAPPRTGRAARPSACGRDGQVGDALDLRRKRAPPSPAGARSSPAGP